MAVTTVTEQRRLTALRAACLFDGTSSTLRAHPMVVLDGGTIRSVEEGGAPPAGAEVIDLGGSTLMPGLIDTHVHLAFDASADPVGALGARDDDETLAAMRQAAQIALRGGVTTVRDLGDRGYLSLRLRGAPDLPTIVAAGPPITTPDGHCHYLGGVAKPGSEGMRTAVREHVDRGVDVIKVMASGGALTAGTRPEETQFSVPELRAAVAEAHRHGLPLTAHVHGSEAIRNAIDAEVDGMEHVSFWSEEGVDEPGELIELIAERQVIVGAGVGLRLLPGAVPPPPVALRLPAIAANTRRLFLAGAVIAAGTDAGVAPAKPHDVLHRALPQLIDFGMDAAKALRTLTSVAAEVCGLANRKGRVAAGYDADILAVDGNPITDIEALHRIRTVFRCGREIAKVIAVPASHP